ncbi:MAG: hypothetical protein ACLTLY_11360 [Agathobacter rectalis]
MLPFSKIVDAGGRVGFALLLLTVEASEADMFVFVGDAGPGSTCVLSFLTAV